MNSEFSDPMDMDSSLLQLERELQSLTPVAPGREFLRSLQARMEPSAPASRVNKVHAFPWRRMVAPAAAAAAAVAVMSIQHRRSGVPDKTVADGNSNAAPVFKWEPMPMRKEYRELLDAGYVLDEDLQPVQIDSRFLNHPQWRNASDYPSNPSAIPSQQHFLMPAGFEGNESRRFLQFH